MAEEQEDSIDVSLDDCRRWSEEINESLDRVRAERGEDAYKLAFMTAFLLTWFAQSIEAEDDAPLKISKPGKEDLN